MAKKSTPKPTPNNVEKIRPQNPKTTTGEREEILVVKLGYILKAMGDRNRIGMMVIEETIEAWYDRYVTNGPDLSKPRTR